MVSDMESDTGNENKQEAGLQSSVENINTGRPAPFDPDAPNLIESWQRFLNDFEVFEKTSKLLFREEEFQKFTLLESIGARAREWASAHGIYDNTDSKNEILRKIDERVKRSAPQAVNDFKFSRDDKNEKQGTSDETSEDESLESDGSPGSALTERTAFANDDEKRAHHSARERKRRDQINIWFNLLQDAVSNGEVDAGKISRAEVLTRVTEYIKVMRKRNAERRRNIQDLQHEIQFLNTQADSLEAKERGTQAVGTSTSDVKIKEPLSSQALDGAGSAKQQDEGQNLRKLIKKS